MESLRRKSRSLSPALLSFFYFGLRVAREGPREEVAMATEGRLAEIVGNEREGNSVGQLQIASLVDQADG